MTDDREAVLRWTCQACGWNVLVPMPGFAGDGHRHHYGASPFSGCGPLVATREGYLLAKPGTAIADLNALLAQEDRIFPARPGSRLGEDPR